ncbi:MAG: DUF1579 family protein [Planctomycetota bacterium]
MPQPGAEHRRLERLAGTWTGEETLYPSPWAPEGATAVGRIEARIGLGGFFLVSDYTEERDERVWYRGHGVYGWDPKRERYTMSWFDSLGSVPRAPSLGVWEGQTLAFQDPDPRCHSRDTYEWAGPDRHRFRIETSRDGAEWSPMMEATFRKSG